MEQTDGVEHRDELRFTGAIAESLSAISMDSCLASLSNFWIIFCGGRPKSVSTILSSNILQ